MRKLIQSSQIFRFKFNLDNQPNIKLNFRKSMQTIDDQKLQRSQLFEGIKCATSDFALKVEFNQNDGVIIRKKNYFDSYLTNG
jgi:hypothetical protein